jgi:hypothetical protein
MRTRYSESEFISAVEHSVSIASVLKALGLSPTGANYVGVKLRAKKLGISLEHFTGQAYLKGKSHTWAPTIPLKEILVKDSTYVSTNSLKRRLIRDGLLDNVCSRCGNDSWMNRPLSLQLEHINGDNRDHRRENLTLLCPNCHSQTLTYAGRNKGRRGSPMAGGD